MAKASDDVILRDRMQFELDNAGDRTTLYGRIDLSNWVNPITRQGLAIKEVFFQLRNSASLGLSNTGIFNPVANWISASTSEGITSALKMYALSLIHI